MVSWQYGQLKTIIAVPLSVAVKRLPASLRLACVSRKFLPRGNLEDGPSAARSIERKTRFFREISRAAPCFAGYPS